MTSRAEFLAGLRELGLHIIGAVFAITILITAIAVALRVVPMAVSHHSTAVRLADQQWSITLPQTRAQDQTVQAQTGATRTDVRRRTGKWRPDSHPVRRRFMPPPSFRPIIPELPEFPSSPEIASIVAEAITPPVPEFAFPPKPRRRVVRALAVLAQPFRSIGAFLSRNEAALSAAE